MLLVKHALSHSKCEILMRLLMEIISHLLPSRGAYIFGQKHVLTMQESSLLQNIPKTYHELKVWTQRFQFMNEN